MVQDGLSVCKLTFESCPLATLYLGHLLRREQRGTVMNGKSPTDGPAVGRLLYTRTSYAR